MNMLTILGFVATVIFGLLSVFLYIRGKRNKHLTFTFETTELQAKKHPEIKITFKGREIENLSRLRVVCWNSGNEAIRWSDVPQNGPPTIKFKQGTLLSVACVGINEETRTTTEQRDDHSLSFSFAYLNPRDWAFLEALYEGSSKASELDFIARIIGGRSTSRRYQPPTNLFDLIFACLVGLGLLAFGALSAYPALVKHVTGRGVFIAVVTIGIPLFIFIGFIRQWMSQVPEPARSYLAGRANPQWQSGPQNQQDISTTATAGKTQ